MTKKILFCALSLLLTACATAPAPEATTTALSVENVSTAVPSQAQINSEVQVFAKNFAKENVMSYQDIMAILNQAQVQQSMINLMNQPLEKLSWARYQDLYVRPSLVSGGVNFWNENATLLASASKQYGVPSQYIVAILGVETVYGKNQGKSRAIDALYTLSFYYPRRAAFFQNELAAYLIMTNEGGFDPLTMRSSYAGALGMPQFMPSTYRQYAVSVSRGYPNLFTSPGDVIGSIGNYLNKMGWQADAPIIVPARFSKNVKLTGSLRNDTLTLEQFKAAGIHAEIKLPGNLKACLISFDGKNGIEYWLAFHNFYVIKRYNSSNLYAMSVYQLGNKILQQRILDQIPAHQTRKSTAGYKKPNTQQGKGQERAVASKDAQS